MERTLYEIAGEIGTPLLIDNVTRNRQYGHYARILVDLDLSKTIFYEVMVEREGFAFPLVIEYEGLPGFCSHCCSIGHNINSCRQLHPRSVERIEQPTNLGKKNVDNGKQPVHSQRSKQTWKSKDRPEGIGSSKAFASVENNQQDNSITSPTLQIETTAVPTQQPESHTEPTMTSLQNEGRTDMADVTTTVVPT
jgi:hypothetical protein